MSREHIVKVNRTASYGSWAYCETCGWQGPTRSSNLKAASDAARHADDAVSEQQPAPSAGIEGE